VARLLLVKFFNFTAQNNSQPKMKKLLSILAIVGLVIINAGDLLAQDAAATDTAQETAAMADSAAADSTAAAADSAAADSAEAAAADTQKEEPKEEAQAEEVIEGGPSFMGIVLLTLILGLAISIERIIYLNLATPNAKKLLAEIEEALQSGGVEKAKEVCRNTRGPVASIFYQALERHDEGIEMVEKSVESYGSVQLGLLERNVSWISLFIALAPMLGFMGTVIGMIGAFDSIEAAGDISPSLVAGGIKVALLTTVFGLIVAVILQIFYNYIISKVDSISNTMEDASISLVDMLVKYESNNKK
jgi:biopolymer transport protein ExbB